MLPLPFFIYVELTAFIISLLTYNSLKGTAFRPFPFFLLFIVTVELTGTYMAKVLHQQNAWLLNPLEGELHKVPMFWLSTGIQFFYLGDLSFDLLYNLEKSDAMGRVLFNSINNNLILILYSCFIIAFLCQRSLVKSLLP